jgi:ribosome-associated protein
LVREVLASRLDREDRLRVISQEHRERPQNLEAALRRMEILLCQALVPRAPRVATRPTRGSQRRRLADKRHQGDKKRGRREDSD